MLHAKGATMSNLVLQLIRCFSTCTGNAWDAGANVGSDCIASQEDLTVIGAETPEVLGHKLDGESSADGT